MNLASYKDSKTARKLLYAPFRQIFCIFHDLNLITNINQWTLSWPDKTLNNLFSYLSLFIHILSHLMENKNADHPALQKGVLKNQTQEMVLSKVF